MRPLAYAFAGSLLAAALARSGCALADSTEQRAIDPAKSIVRFSIMHVFVEHVTGTLPILSGSVNLPAGATIPLSATAVLDATKIDTADPDRDASLESPNYFDAKKFSTWTFTSTKIVPSGPAAFGMDGMLTIHGVTQPEHLDVTVRGDASHLAYHATGHIDRHAFGMKGTRLDPAIGDVADVTLDLTV